MELFLKEKSDLKMNVLALIKELKAKDGYIIKYIWCDNAGENLALEIACQQERLGIHFEYAIPQQNGRVERKFATLFRRVCAILNGVGFDKFWGHDMKAEAVNTATLVKKN